jgi:hypothetical protein
MYQQAQLLNIILDPKDVVYTPDWVASDMVQFFQPSGSILEPSKGDGVFLKYLPPETDWCEIAEGRDFFKYTKSVDWIVGNPPFKQFDKFLLHSFSVAVNVVYLIPADKPFNALPRARMIAKNGGIVHMRYYVDGPQMEMPGIHRPMAAFHFQRGYSGAMGFSFAVPCLTSRAADLPPAASLVESNAKAANR